MTNTGPSLQALRDLEQMLTGEAARAAELTLRRERTAAAFGEYVEEIELTFDPLARA